MSFLSTDGLWLRRRAAEGAVASIRKCLVAVLGLVLTVAAQAVTQDITGQFAITRSGLVLNRTTNTFDSTVTLKNTSGAPVLAPIDVVVSGLPAGVTLANKTGRQADGKPYVSPMPAGSLLQSGGTLSFVLKFANPAAGDVHQHAADPLYRRACRRECAEPDRRGGDRRNERLSDRARGRRGEPGRSRCRCRRPQPASSGTLVGGAPVGATVAATTDAAGYFGVTVSGVNPGAFVAVQVTSPAASPSSLCQVSSRDNDSWPKAFLLDGSPATAQDFIDAPGKARWYKFAVTPGQRIEVKLSGLPADYDLAVFKDIGQAFASQFNPADGRRPSIS